MLKNVTLQETDTFDEVNRTLNRIIDNLNLVENKVLVLDKTVAKKSWVRKLLTPKEKKGAKNKGMANTKTLLMALLCGAVLLYSVAFGTVDTTEITFDVVTSGIFDQKLRGWIDTLNDDITNAGVLSNVGTGNIYFVDSGLSNSATAVGTRPEWAWPTLDDAFDTGHVTANNGDIVFLIQGHNENWSAADSADIDVAGVTVVALGEGTDRARFDYDGTAAELVVGAENIRLINLTFQPSITGIVHAVEFEADSDGSILEGCEFLGGEAAGDEFLNAIEPAVGADDLIIRWNKATETTAGASTWLDLSAGIVDNIAVYGNEVFGDFASACIYSDKVCTQMLVKSNILSNTQTGDHAIELTAAATGMGIGNMLYTDAEGTAFDPGSLKCIENYVSTAIDQTAVLVPATAGVKRYVSKAQTAVKSGTPNLFDVDGGPILITSFSGLITTLIGGTTTTMQINFDADSGWTDYGFSTAVAITNDSAGHRYVFTNVNPSVLTPLAGASAGATIFETNWLCGEGMIEGAASTNDNDGAITWYMEYIPLTSGVTVTAQ